MSTEEKLQRKGLNARKKALDRLLANHAEEWETLLSEERKALGLFPKIKRVTIAEMREELAKAHAEIQRLGGGQHNQ